MKSLFPFYFILFTSLALLSCDSNDPQSASTLNLSVEDVSCTEAWLQLTTNNVQLPVTINLLNNNSISQIFILKTQDSLLYIDSLLPNQNYKFLITMQQSNNASNELSITTIDTTSHNFTWQTFEFGEHSSSSLYDVAIINQNDIWAVGEIYTADSYTYDSLGNWIDPYNAVHWDGESWKLIRIYYNYNGTNIWSPIRTILAFSTNDIWFSAGIHWNGEDFVTKPMNIDFPYLINKMWGESSNDFYVVGSAGSLAHNKTNVWRKLTSGTQFYLADIMENNAGDVFIVGNKSSEIKGIVIKSTDGINFSTFVESEVVSESQIFKPKLAGSLTSVWIDKNNTLYVAGDFLYQYKLNKWNYVTSFPHNYLGGNYYANYFGFITGISGNYSNDMWVVGDRNTVRHFNGISWQQIGIPYNPNSNISWLDVDVKNNITAIIGSQGNRAAIMIIKR